MITALLFFLPTQDNFLSWILELVWLVFLVVYMFFGQRIQTWGILVGVNHAVNELELMKHRARMKAVETIIKVNGKAFDPTPAVDRILDFVTIQPENMDPAGVVWKLEHILNVREVRLKDEVRALVPSAEKEAVNNLVGVLEAAQAVNVIYKTVRHYYLLGRKSMSLYVLMQLDMQLPKIMAQAKAYMNALEAFSKGQPIGDGAGALVAAKLMYGSEKTLLVEETVMAEVLLEGRRVYVVKAEGPGAAVGKPGEAIKKILEQNLGRVSAIITVDAALKNEGEESGEIAEGVGVAIGGVGVEQFKVEENMLKQKVPVYSVIVKEGVDDAFSPMNKQVAEACERAVERVKMLIRERAREGDTVIVAGIGNTVGIGQ